MSAAALYCLQCLIFNSVYAYPPLAAPCATASTPIKENCHATSCTCHPLITVDPFFSIWSPADRLTDTETVHWTGFPNIINATAKIDGADYRFMGVGEAPAMEQISRDMDALTTTYVFEAAGVRLTLRFTSPVLPDDLYLLTRPVSYLAVEKKSTDGKAHTVSLRFAVSEQICLDMPGDDEVVVTTLSHGGVTSVKMGSKGQNILNREGDCARIDWGYFYLSSNQKGAAAGSEKKTVVTYNGFLREDNEIEMTFCNP